MSRFSQTLFSSVRQTRHLANFMWRHMAVVNCCLFVISLSLSLTYVVQVNRSATNGYQIRDLETTINQLELANQNFQIKLAETRSAETVAMKVPMLGMVKTKTPPVFLNNQASTVSLNR
ncbi:MAG: hypothetical protein V1664_00840 [Candidatus Uhrbacteria bacterium]